MSKTQDAFHNWLAQQGPLDNVQFWHCWKAASELSAQRIAELEQQRDELQARWDGIQHLIKANGAGSVSQLAAQRDELIAASDEAVSEMKATAWDEEGYLLNPDLDDAANSLRATIAKVKP